MLPGFKGGVLAEVLAVAWPGEIKGFVMVKVCDRPLGALLEVDSVDLDLFLLWFWDGRGVELLGDGASSWDVLDGRIAGVASGS